jgi:DNA-binding MarR family transcriptional regulator/predicted GNAT family acetyltransferase
MDIVKQLGELALGSRLKRLSDTIMRNGTDIYQANKIDFEPRWFPVFYTLAEYGDMTVTDLAREIGVKHPTISQTVKELERRGLVSSSQCEEDGRRRILTISQEGKDMLPKMRPVWNDISNAIHSMIQEHKHNILCAIESFEQDFDSKCFFDRVNDETQKRQLDEVDILDYQPELSADFKRISLEWIEKDFNVEEEDTAILNHPEKIIDNGGTIVFARYQNEIVGTCALIKKNEQTYELSKMGVTEKARGRQIGKKLGLAVIDKAQKLGASIFDNS